MKLVDSVTICEVGPRDGLQNEKQILNTDDKVQLINGITDAEIKAVDECDGKTIIITDERKITLEGKIVDNDLVGAGIIAFEIGEGDDNSLYLGLLCESSDGSLFDKIIPVSSIEVEEIAEA